MKTAISRAKPVKKAGRSLPDHKARRKRIWGERVFTAKEIEKMRTFETGEP